MNTLAPNTAALPQLNEQTWRVRLSRRICGIIPMHGFPGADRLREFLAGRLMPLPAGAILVRTAGGLSLRVEPSREGGLEKSLYFFGTYEPGTLNVISRCLRPGDTFIDVGSNIGLMALHAAKCCGPQGRVWAFEPHPETFSILKENIAVNGIENIRPLQLALGSGEEERPLFRAPGSTRGDATLVAGRQSGGLPIRIRPLDALMAEEQISPVRMMKIDVEGWELEALRGAGKLLRSPHAPILCVEYSRLHHQADGPVSDIHQFIRDCNDYRVFRLAKGKDRVSSLLPIRSSGELPHHDNLFCFLPSHLKELPSGMFSR